MADDYTVRFNADTSNATSNIKKLTQSIAEFSKSTQPAATSSALVAKNFSFVEQSSIKTTIALAKQKDALAKLNAESSKTPRRASMASGSSQVVTPPPPSTARRVTTGVISAGDSAKSLTVISAAQEKVVQTGKPVVNSFQAIQAASIKNAFAINQSSAAVERLAGRLPTLRYALYDVSNNLLITTGAMTAMSVASLGLAAQYQRDFSNVIRTTGATGEAAQALLADFIELKTQIPVSWAELTNIGTLAGQLNVAQQDIADFTKNVAMFAATTDVTAEAAATAFGRLDQLINGVNGDYEALASSILAVGVNSVATESQIIAVAQNIASIGNQAGLTADQLIGFSGALASVGIQPELARGLTTRLFTEISTSVSQGSVQLENFGRVAGMSGDQFAAAWSSNAGLTLVQFLKGLNAEGKNAEASLAQLGITSVRDVPNILKLSQGYEEVGRLLGVSARGYSESEELAAQYAVITQTIAEKLNLLVQNFQLFIAASGSGVTVLGGLLDVLNNVLATLTQLASTPFGAGFLTTTNIIVGLLGVLGLLAAGVLRGTAAFVAFKTTQIEAGIASGVFTAGTKAADVSLKQLTGSLFSAAGATKIFNLAIKASIIGLAISVGIGLITTAVTAMTESMKSASDRAKDMFGSLDSLKSALNADAQAISATEEAVGTFTSAIDGSTHAIGRNTAELIANTLQNDENFKKILENAEKIKDAGGPILDAPKFIAMYAKGDTDEALAYYEDYQRRVAEFQNDGSMVVNPYESTDSSGSAYAQDNAPAYESATTDNSLAPQVDYTFTTSTTADLQAAEQVAQNVDVALQEAASSTTVFDETMKALGFDTASTSDEMKDFNGILSEYREALNDAFGEQNLMGAFSSDFDALVAGIEEGGTSFNAFSESGRTNLSNLQSSIASTLAASKSLGVDSSEAVALQFMELQKQGVDTAQLLAMLAGMNIPGVDVRAVGQFLSGTKQMSAGGQQLSGTFQRMGASARGASKDIGGTTAKVVTLIDYANDLSSVYKRAFEIRFDAAKNLDKITKGWQEIRESTEEANEEIKDIRNTIDGLTADKALQEYFLSVAEAYGDSLKASQIRSDIAEIDADLAKENRNLSKAQGRANKTLVGNSEAAIENRSTILGLVSDYQDYIKSLAASGASQEQLQAATAAAKADFMAQATQLGYNSNELGIYSAAFDDVSTAIRNVPRNVTVTANTNPALQALNEFDAKMRAQSGKSYSGGTITAPVNEARLTAVGPLLDPSDVGITRRALEKLNPQSLILIGRQLFKQGWADGGYTGAGGKYDVAGIVHRGEYVVPKSEVNQTTKLPYFMEQQRSFAQGGYVGAGPSTMMVMLSPEDRALLRNVGGSGEVVLYANNEAIARSANMGNKSIVAVGGRP